MKKNVTIIRKDRIRPLFNTGTRPHKSMKDYTRKVKHKKKDIDNGE